MMGCDRRFEADVMTGRQRAVQVAAVTDHPGLVERRPELHAIVEFAEDHARVLGEPVGNVGVEPTAQVIERRGQVPVKQRDERHAVVEKPIDQPIVNASPALFTAPTLQNTRPRDEG